nr:RNA-directed DNA polymerase, eukaryota, reverse transcriptase zinc-binding domain protein [Tanacetum cinerariifolium]
MYCLVKKMKHLKPILNKLNWKNGDLTVNVEKLILLLKENQALVEKNPYNREIKAKSIEILEEYNIAVNDEEKLLAQKARIDWINDGDKNNAFFHKVIKGRRSRNMVHSIYDENGINFKGENVPKQFVKDFQQFLGKADAVSDLNVSNGLFYNSLSNEEASNMIKEVSDKEIKEALFDIGDNKSPGPDGYSSVFFKNAWDIIGKNGLKRCAIKIDLQKAYDTVNWNFLEAILINFGFHKRMVEWIMVCVKSAGFLICINGERHGYFKGGRGLRQGDSISPYLFTLVMKTLTLIIQKQIRIKTGCK